MSALLSSAVDLGVFFGDGHRALAKTLTRDRLAKLAGDHQARSAMREMGELGLLAYLLPEKHGGAAVGRAGDAHYVDVRSLVVIREALGQVAPMADAIFAVQGLGSFPLVLAGDAAQRAKYLASVLRGDKVAAFALTEPEAGSDVASLRTTAKRGGDDWILDGEKILISNVPDADYWVVFANADPDKGRKGISAFVVDAGASGASTEVIPMSIPHPIGKISFKGCRVPASALIGEVGQGFRIAMETLDTFRVSVGGAANGMAARALEESIARVKSRRQFGAALSDQQIVKAYLAEMATELDAARLLVARAAHKHDVEGGRISAEVAMAKMYATEAAQRIIDKAVQLHGGWGVCSGSVVEALYREIRPLRIYEGTTEIQKLILAKALLER